MNRIIAIDVGAGTADIVIRRDDEPAENSVKLVVPSQTQVVAAQIRRATRSGTAVLFTGPTMGGGADTRAMKDHTAAGLPFLATEAAARSFADDLERVRARGVQIVGDDEASRLRARGSVSGDGGTRDLTIIRSGDVDGPALLDALRRLGVDTRFSAIAVAVQDHGFQPRGSNRILRFTLWDEAVRERRPLTQLFYWMRPPAHDPLAAGRQPVDACSSRDPNSPSVPRSLSGPRSSGIPPVLTRMRAAASCAAALGGDDTPLLAGDTGPAALLGALEDHRVREEIPDPVVLVNAGNGHTIAAVAESGRLVGVYEHHTGLLDGPRLAGQLRRFLAGDLDGGEVRDDGGHGAVLAHPCSLPSAILVTGPNRRLLEASGLPVCYPAPWGDMMISGAVGLVQALLSDETMSG